VPLKENDCVLAVETILVPTDIEDHPCDQPPVIKCLPVLSHPEAGYEGVECTGLHSTIGDLGVVLRAKLPPLGPPSSRPATTNEPAATVAILIELVVLFAVRPMPAIVSLRKSMTIGEPFQFLTVHENRLVPVPGLSR
jgi:hypothetical protein